MANEISEFFRIHFNNRRVSTSRTDEFHSVTFSVSVQLTNLPSMHQQLTLTMPQYPYTPDANPPPFLRAY